MVPSAALIAKWAWPTPWCGPTSCFLMVATSIAYGIILAVKRAALAPRLDSQRGGAVVWSTRNVVQERWRR